MKTSVQNDIKIPKSGFKRSKFNWSHDVNTTFGWGEVQPTECKLLVPNSKTIVNNKALVRFAPMVAPTFGRVRYKSFSQFVPIEDVYPNLGSFLSREPKSGSSQTKVVKKLLSAPLGHISSWAFIGARATLYFAIDTSDGKNAHQNAEAGNYITWYRQNNKSDSTQSDWRQWFDKLQNYSYSSGSNKSMFSESSDILQHVNNNILPLIDGLVLNLGFAGSVFESMYPYSAGIPLSCKNFNDLCPVRRDYEPNLYNGESPLASYQQEVTFDSADYVIESSVKNPNGDDYVYYALAIELSDYGKRIRKIIQGCGYQLNLLSNESLSVLPLIAQYKAYFDVFGLTLYQGWETTWTAKFIKYCENDFIEELTEFYPSPMFYSSLTEQFLLHAAMFLEIGDEWYTERPDFYGAHIARLGVSPKASGDGFITMDGGTYGNWLNHANVFSPGYVDSNGVAASQKESNSIGSANALNPTDSIAINDITHTYVDSVVLKRLTKWINKYSILGRAVDKILRAFGLGKYLDSWDTKFIGNTDKMLTISDVVSFAATADASLGEYGGKGLEYFEDDKLVFENDVFGYWFTLSAIVPEAGYTQNIDLTLACVKPEDMYQADFDAIGMEATSKESLVASSYLIDGDSNFSQTRHTFGFVPRLSKWKVHKNLVNGDFNRHGLRSVYLPYTLDKQLNVNDFDVSVSDYKNPQGALIYNFVRLNKSKNVANLPCAGNWARTPTKYRWLGHFDRIFKLEDSDVTSNDSEDLVQLIGFADFNRDNFMYHGISSMTCWAPMKPIEESYGLEQDEDNPNQVGSDFVNKA